MGISQPVFRRSGAAGGARPEQWGDAPATSYSSSNQIWTSGAAYCEKSVCTHTIWRSWGSWTWATTTSATCSPCSTCAWTSCNSSTYVYPPRASQQQHILDARLEEVQHVQPQVHLPRSHPSHLANNNLPTLQTLSEWNCPQLEQLVACTPALPRWQPNRAHPQPAKSQLWWT